MATFSFCEQCNNLLYPKEDRENAKLTYACRNCIYQSETSNNCVYRNDIQHPINEANIVIRDLAADPTLPRTTEKRCKQCGCDLAVYFQSQSRRPDTKMTLFYVCANTNCGFLWTDFDPKKYEDVGVDHSNIEQQDDWRNGMVYSENFENPNPPDLIVNSVENIKVEQPTQNTHKDEDW
ncbi:12226_t:CDS:2 [Entrophospora sp. SA101]|nr:12226_t:CDS:2 [Entrophospora sp. SA101]